MQTNYQPHSNYDRVLLKCGIEPNPPNIDTEYAAPGGKEAILNQFKESVESSLKSDDVQKMGLDVVAKEIKTHFREVSNLEPTKIDKIAKKLDEMIKTRSDEEANFGLLHRFFHKLMHLIKLEGFCSTAEYAAKIQKSLNGLEEKKAQFKEQKMLDYFKKGVITLGGEVQSNIQNAILDLTPERIKMHAEKDNFNFKNPANIFSFDKIIPQLNEKQKTAFFEGLFNRKEGDGLLLLTAFLDGQSSATILPFLPHEKVGEEFMYKHLGAHHELQNLGNKENYLKDIKQLEKNLKNANDTKLYLAECTIKHYLARKKADPTSIAKNISLFGQFITETSSFTKELGIKNRVAFIQDNPTIKYSVLTQKDIEDFSKDIKISKDSSSNNLIEFKPQEIRNLAQNRVFLNRPEIREPNKYMNILDNFISVEQKKAFMEMILERVDNGGLINIMALMAAVTFQRSGNEQKMLEELMPLLPHWNIGKHVANCISDKEKTTDFTQLQDMLALEKMPTQMRRQYLAETLILYFLENKSKEEEKSKFDVYNALNMFDPGNLKNIMDETIKFKTKPLLLTSDQIKNYKALQEKWESKIEFK